MNDTGANPTDYVPASGSRTLTASDLADLRAAIDAVYVSSQTWCETNPERTLTMFQGSTQMVYGDETEACEKMYPAYVTGLSLDALVAELTLLTGL